MEVSTLQACKIYLITIPIFFLIDLAWLGLLAKDFYQKHLGFLFGPKVNWTAALLFYFLFIVGILFFVVIPGLEADSLRRTIVRAALFGLITYATYDLTNLATIRDWPLIVTVVDLMWGTVLCGGVAWASYAISAKAL